VRPICAICEICGSSVRSRDVDAFTRQLDWIDLQRERMVNRVIAWANVNSHTHHLAGLEKMSAAVGEALRELGATPEWIDLPAAESIDEKGDVVREPLGRAVRARVRPDAPLCIFLGIHIDTVYPVDHPFQLVRQIDANTINGPGVIDAKGGLVVLLTALAALETSEFRNRIGWEVLINSDEEIGSPGSAALLVEAAKRNHVGLVFEPALA